MKKTKISFYFIFISFLTLLTVFFSIIQKSYFSFVTPQKLVEDNALLTDINPNLDLTVISTIESKNQNIDQSFDFSIIKVEQKKTDSNPLSIETTLAPTETQTPTPTLTETPTLTPTL